MESIFQPTATYRNFTPHHWIPLGILTILCLAIIIYFRNHDKEKNFRVAFFMSLIPFAAVVSRLLITWYEGIFTIQEELPLHLCRLVAISLPFFIWYRNIKWINTLYFLIMVGTLQAIITADLQFVFPHYSYLLYWVFHVTLVWVPVFIIINLGIKPDFNDFKRAFIIGNIYMLITLLINFAIGSNYFYTRQKPPGGSLLDFFGPWPFYILVVEVLAMILFVLAYLPFYKKENR
ncbi:MAG: TIGR02206 family membrane protein [Saprospiraceae bacterium]|nr:TIGR02206 family membrane protein [Saprospiraceae bacterium]